MFTLCIAYAPCYRVDASPTSRTVIENSKIITESTMGCRVINSLLVVIYKSNDKNIVERIPRIKKYFFYLLVLFVIKMCVLSFS